MLHQDKPFSVISLTADISMWPNAFGSSSLRAERFRDGGWQLSERGVPIMAEAIARSNAT